MNPRTVNPKTVNPKTVSPETMKSQIVDPGITSEHTMEGEAVDAPVHERRARHPLQQRGAGRTLYAAGLALELVGMLCILSAYLFSALDAAATIAVAQPGAFLLGMSLQFGGQRLCSRAWWHLPLRSADAPPDAVELLFWSLNAAVVVAAAAVAAFVRPSPDAFSLWVLVGVAGLLALLPEVTRPAPEPPAMQVWRTAPLGAAALVVLGLGVVSGAFTTTAVLVAVVVLGAGLVAQRAWLRRRYR